MIYTTTISDESLCALKLLFETLKTQDDVSDKTCTNGGFQTPNAINSLPRSVKVEITSRFKEYLSLIGHESAVVFKHIHFIEYYEGGSQDPHTHEHREDFSCVIYLNNSDGDTVFNVNGEPRRISPEESKAVFFPSDVLHWAEKSMQNKQVAVAAFITF